MKKMHDEIGHFGEARMFVEIKKCFFLHDRTYFVKEFVKVCDRCQLAKQTGNMKSKVEGMKNTLVCDIFYLVVLDIARPLLKTSNGKQICACCHRPLFQVV